MSDFKAKMHLIRFPLGLPSGPRWGRLLRCPDPQAVFKGPTSKGRKDEGREGKGKRRGWQGRGRRGELAPQ